MSESTFEQRINDLTFANDEQFANALQDALQARYPGLQIIVPGTDTWAVLSASKSEIPIPKNDWQATGMALLGLMYLMKQGDKAGQDMLDRARRCVAANSLVP